MPVGAKKKPEDIFVLCPTCLDYECPYANLRYLTRKEAHEQGLDVQLSQQDLSTNSKGGNHKVEQLVAEAKILRMNRAGADVLHSIRDMMHILTDRAIAFLAKMVERFEGADHSQLYIQDVVEIIQ